MKTRWAALAAGGLVVATLAACGGSDEGAEGGADDACPSGAPVVELVGFEFAPHPGQEHLTDYDLRQHDVDISFEVTNDASSPIELRSVDLPVWTEEESIDWSEGPRQVAAGETATLDAQVVSRIPSATTLEPMARNIDVEWGWAGPGQGDCATEEAQVQPTEADDPATIATMGTAPPPQAPPDALAIGETATFALPSGQEVRVTVTSVSTTGTCPDPAAPPASIGYLFVGVRLEVGPGDEPWRVHATDMNVGRVAAPPLSDAATLCVRDSATHNDLNLGPGQTAEATFVFDGVGPAVWYTFIAYGIEEPQQVAWAL